MLIWILLSLSMLSSALRPDNVFASVAPFLTLDERNSSRLVNREFARNLQYDVTDALQRLKALVNGTLVNRSELKLIYHQFRFNEYFLMNYLKILKQNITIFENPNITDVFNLPILTADSMRSSSFNWQPFDLGLSNLGLELDEPDPVIRDLIRLSWFMYAMYVHDLYIEHSPWELNGNVPAPEIVTKFNGYQMLYQLLWSYAAGAKALPLLQDVYDSKENQTQMRNLRSLQKRYRFVVWHHSIAMPSEPEPNVLDMYLAAWNVGVEDDNRIWGNWLMQLMNENRTWNVTESNKSVFSRFLFSQLSFNVDSGEWKRLELFFSCMKNNSRLHFLTLKYNTHFPYGWLTCLDSAELVSFLDMFLRYVAPVLNKWERIAMTENFRTMHGTMMAANDMKTLASQLHTGNTCDFVHTFIHLMEHYWKIVLNIDDQQLGDLQACLLEKIQSQMRCASRKIKIHGFSEFS
eukprot:116581_1